MFGAVPSGTATILVLSAGWRPADMLRTAGGSGLRMEYVPRISRAQSMDALVLDRMVAGYRGAMVAAEMLGQFFPLSMTAAGTVPPAQVVVLGAGVAGPRRSQLAGAWVRWSRAMTYAPPPLKRFDRWARKRSSCRCRRSRVPPTMPER